MTNEEAALRMCAYYDDECTDGEEQELFLHLSVSAHSRSLFRAMGGMKETLRSKPADGYPDAIDERLSSLLMTPRPASLMHRTVTMSVPSVLLTVFVVCLLSLTMFVMMSRSSVPQPSVDPRAQTASMYFSGADRDHANEN
jgi:hypothetical protein